MKRLVRISIDGLKSHDRTSIDVPKLLAIHGPNGSGKTSIFQAVRLAILGYEPSLGKKLEYTRQLIGPGRAEATIALEFEDGFAIRRQFGDSTTTRLHPTHGEHTERLAQKRIDEETSAFVPAFDLSEFLQLSAEKRRAYLLAMLPREAAGLDQAMWRQWLGYEAAADSIRNSIDRLWNETVLTSSSVLDGLASALEYTNSVVNTAERERREQETIASRAAADAEASARSTAWDEGAGAKLQEELHEVESKLGDLEARADLAVRTRTQERQREEDRSKLDVRIRDQQQSVERLQVELDNLVVPTAEEISDLRQAAEYADRKARSQVDAVNRAAEQLAAARALFGEAMATVAALDGKDSCPTCGSATPEDFRSQWNDRAKEFSARVQEVETKLESARTLQSQLEDAAAKAAHALKTHEQQLAYGQGIAKRLEEGRDRLAGLQEQRKAYDGLAAVDVDPPEPEEISKLQRRAAEIRREIEKDRQAAVLHGRAQGDRIRADRERETLTKKTERAEALKALYQAQQKLRAHVIQQLVVPVEQVANELLQTIDPAKTFRFLFEREGRLDFDFGFEEGGVFRSYDAASTGEDAFLAVVLVAALISVVRPKWRVLLVDNAESIDDLRRGMLLRALSASQEYFDNVIIAGCCRFETQFAEEWVELDMRDINPVKAWAA